MHTIEYIVGDTANFSINLSTAQDLILDDINVVGIYYSQFTNIPDDKLVKNFKNVFKVVVKQDTLENYNSKINSYYMFPDS
jgi:hypothetical protein